MSIKMFSYNPNQILQERKNKAENLVSNLNKTFEFEQNSQKSFCKLLAKTPHWTNSEKSKYLIFICYFRSFIGLKEEKSLEWVIFRCMAKFIQSRNPQQCRSHHLKLLKIYQTIESFIFKALKKFPMLSEKFAEVQDKLKELQQEFKLYQIKLSKSLNGKQMENGFSNIENQIMNGNYNIKEDKLGMMKTSDEYYESQKCVKNTSNISFGFSGYGSFKGKSQLPNFGEQVQSSSEEKFQNNKDVQNGEKYLQKGFQCQNPKINSQRMKDIFQCQFLYQLWSKKLEQIMTNPTFYNMKSCGQE